MLEGIPPSGYRLGRTLHCDTSITWRWTGFLYGVDLHCKYSDRCFFLRRNTLQRQGAPNAANWLVSRKEPTKIAVSISFVQFAEDGAVVWSYSSPTYEILLLQNDDVQIYRLPYEVFFPIHLGFFINFSSE